MSVVCKSVQFCADKSTYCDVIQGQVELNQLSRLVRWHGLIGPVMKFLQSQPSANAATINRLKPVLVRKSIDQALSLRQLNILIKLFEYHDIRYVVFKGIAAKAQFITPCIDIVRSSSDIDLLVSPENFPSIVNIMQEQGYYCVDCINPLDVAQCVARSADMLCKRGLVFRHSNPKFFDVDIHWRAANTFSLPLPTHEILKRKQNIIIGELKLFIPCFEHHFIISAIHGYLDYFFQLKHLADLFFAMQHEHYDESEILSMAQSYGVRQQVESSIELARTMFNENAGRALPRSNYVRSTLKRYAKYSGIVIRPQKAGSRWSLYDKARYIFRQTTTRSHKASIMAPLQNRFLIKFDQISSQTHKNSNPI